MASIQPGKIVLTLPAYNEADNLRPLIEAATKTFHDGGFEFAILVVNDGSQDKTPEVLSELVESHGIHVINHPVNRGLGAAILTGINNALDYASGPQDIIVGMDADNTHNPNYIPEMTQKIWDQGFDVVIASRYQVGSEEVGVPWNRRLLSRGARLLFQLTLRLPDVRDYTCGYRAYRAEVLRQAVKKYGQELITRQGFACTDELLVKLSTLTKKMTEIPFVLRYDQKRSTSKLPLFKTIIETLKMLLFHR
jgi:dolichol-phosphate mannosyltransferase